MLKIFFFSVLLGGILCNKRTERAYIVVMMILLFLTISLRHQVCFMDTPHYVSDYQNLSNMEYSSISDYFSKDVFFWYFSKAVSQCFGDSYTMWFVILSLIYICPLYVLLKKYSKNVQISLILFCCLGFALFSMTGLRQTLAMGMTLGALCCLLDSKKFLFFILTIIGCLFHKSAIVFLLLYPIARMPINKKYIVWYIIGIIAAYVIVVKFLPNFFLSDFDDRIKTYVDSESTLNYSGLIQQILIFTVSCFCLKKEDLSNANRVFIWMSVFGIFFQSMTSVLPEMFRLSMYFSIGNIFLLANALSSRPQDDIVKYIITFVMILYFMISPDNGFLNDYYFFFSHPNIG